MKLLVTGASGFLGKNLLLSLPKETEVTAVYRSADFLAFLKASGLDHVRAVGADLSRADRAEAVAAAGAFQACVFLAANGDPALSLEPPALDLASNCASLVKLPERCSLRTPDFPHTGARLD